MDMPLAVGNLHFAYHAMQRRAKFTSTRQRLTAFMASRVGSVLSLGLSKQFEG